MTNEEFQSLVLSELKSIKEDIGTIKEDVNSLKDDFSTLKEDVSSLKDDVSSLKEDVSSLKETTNRIEHRLDAVFEETAGLAEFRFEVKADMDKHGRLLDILSRRSLLLPSYFVQRLTV